MKRGTAIVVLVGAVALIGACQGKQAAPSPPAAVSPKTDDEKAVYALGAMLGTRFVQPLHLLPAELELLRKGLADTAQGGKPEFPIDEWAPKIDALARSRVAAGAPAEKEKSRTFREAAEREPGAVKTSSGLIFRTLQPGSGKSPGASDVVRVHYHGTLTDGTVFDSSVQRGQPAEFPLNQVIPCWTEGVQRMKVGEKARLVCPSEVAYGDRGAPPNIPGGATLIFDVELLSIRGK